MPIDYTAAGRWQDVVRALATIESGENPGAPLGDSGQAFGILQQHPTFFKENYGRILVGVVMRVWHGMTGRVPLYPVSNTDTLTTAEIKAAASFMEANKALNRTLLIESYHQGVIGAERQPDPTYFTRWATAFAKLKGKWPA